MVEVTQAVSQSSLSQKTSTSLPPPFSMGALWNISFGFFGIQFGWGLQMANGSAIFESLGASPHQLPLLWLAAPMSGLLVQPVIGYWSDRTCTPLGRRRPYFLIGALLSSVALVLLPHAPSLWIAAGLLWLLDASANVSMTPFRSIVLPEIVASLGLGWLMTRVGCDRLSIVVLGGFSMAIAAILAQGIPNSGQRLIEKGERCPPSVSVYNE